MRVVVWATKVLCELSDSVPLLLAAKIAFQAKNNYSTLASAPPDEKEEGFATYWGRGRGTELRSRTVAVKNKMAGLAPSLLFF